jgi:hypothetical protein
MSQMLYHWEEKSLIPTEVGPTAFLDVLENRKIPYPCLESN